MFHEYIEYVELTDPAEQRMAAQWGDPSAPDGRVWLDLADGKPVPAQNFIWAFRTTAEDHFAALLGKQAEWAACDEDVQFLREQLESLRVTGETLLAGVSQAFLARYAASWLMVQPPLSEWRPSADDLLLPTFGDRAGIWRGRFAPVRLLVEQASPLLGREREEVVARLFALADRLHSEALVELEDPPTAWSPEGHRQAWVAAAHAVRGGRQVWVDANPFGLALVIAGDEEQVSLPLRAGIDSAGYRRTPPDLRQTVAELTAIDAAMPHGEPHEWPAAVAARREELMVRLWRTVHGAAWYRWDTPAPVAGYDWDHRDPRRPLVLVVQLPDGPQIRAHVRADAVDEWELADAPVMPWDGTPADYAERVEWLARRVDTR